MSMAERIHQKRTENNMTMEELATRLNVGKSAVNKWEKGYVTNIKRSTIKKMADIFGCSPTWLMGWDEDQMLYVYDDLEEMENERQETISKAMELFHRFEKADPRIQAAVESLLKDVPPES